MSDINVTTLQELEEWRKRAALQESKERQKQELKRQQEMESQFKKDTATVAEQSVQFIKTMYPAYLVESKERVRELSYLNNNNTDTELDAFTFYRLASCMTEDIEDLDTFLNEKMAKFFSAMYSMEKPLIYGVVSYQGSTNLVIGIKGELGESGSAETVKSVMEGLLDGIELQSYEPSFTKRGFSEKTVGFISAAPSVRIGEEKQKFSLSTLMKSLNGQNYTVLFVARPIFREKLSESLEKVIRIKDACFAVSKRNLSRQQGTSHSVGDTRGSGITNTHSEGITRMFGFNTGVALGKILTMGVSFGTGKVTMDAHSVATNVSETITDAVNENKSISAEVQNGFALEMMQYADKAIERLHQGRSNGMWEAVISYSADSEMAAGIIRACITGELAKPAPDMLPLVSQQYPFTKEEAENNSLILPKIVRNEEEASPLCTAVTSEELGMMCTIPTESVPDFELKKGKVYPMVSRRTEGAGLGFLTEGTRQLKNMPFALSKEDLARHTFVCGITGSGKTTTVKRILREAGVPFLVIESAKKEYRNMKLSDDGAHPAVYTLGKPEINCLRFNPFYIPCGVSPQLHIDFLKDLFSASFSFYGPMPYILEKCLHAIYKKKGWNLTMGFHPYLVNMDKPADLFDADYMKEQYRKYAHKFLFPTMQDLKAEIKRYIDEEMQYEGEVAGNIKTAILARLENLCTGAKGYMFNTHEFADMDELMKKNTVFELEGLADDADKAFCVGLFIIFVNEYRQVTESIGASKGSLSHLLVIEEAHRLLKNVDTERSTEETGNPKGKAVEHFTNMIAEMRSYGQGVIIAEQIPTKLAPDVIKNSSNKIIQRLVAADDQRLVANTIGLNDKEALYIGNLEVGRALCHKEGMSLPVNVAITPIEEAFVPDNVLFLDHLNERFHCINTSVVKECIADVLDLQALKILNSILVQDYVAVEESIGRFRKSVQACIVKKDVELIPCGDRDDIYAEILSEAIAAYLLNGAYSVKALISDELADALRELIFCPDRPKLEEVREKLEEAYQVDDSDELRYKGMRIISERVYNQIDEKTDEKGTVRRNFMIPDESTVQEIMSMIKER